MKQRGLLILGIQRVSDLIPYIFYCIASLASSETEKHHEKSKKIWLVASPLPSISKHWFHHPINGDNTTNLRGLLLKAQGQSSIKDRKLTFTEHFQWTRHCDGD